MRFPSRSFAAIDTVVLVRATARPMSLHRAILRRAVLACAPALLAACSVGAPPVDDPVEVPAAAPVAASAARRSKADDYRFHSALGARLRFPVLRSGVVIEERHYDPSLPAHKFRHSIQLSTDAGPAVILEVWDNPQGLDVRAWFDAHLAFLVTPESEVDEGSSAGTPRMSERAMTRKRTAGILVEQPPSGQAPSQSIAVFALGDRMIRVSGLNFEGNATARALFERVVEQIDAEVTR